MIPLPGLSSWRRWNATGITILLLCFVGVTSFESRSAQAAVFRAEDVDAFHRSIRQARPGDVIVMKKGRWSDVELVADANGSEASPIVIRAESPGEVVITGESRFRLAGSHLVVSGLQFRGAWHKTALIEFRRSSKRLAEHCRLTDCQIDDCDPPGEADEMKYVSIYGRHNQVDHCRFMGKTSRGATMVVWLNDEQPKHVVRNNHFGPRPPLGRNGGETIRLGDSETSHLIGAILVTENLFEECNGESEIISNKSCENSFVRNVFYRCSGALTLRHGADCRVECNLFLGDKASGSGGVRIVGSGHVVANNYFERLEGDNYRSALCMMNGIEDSPVNGYQPVQRVVVAHNTFVQCKRTILIGADNDAESQVGPQDCVFANNAIVSRRGPLVEMRPTAKRIRWLGNLSHGLAPLGIEEQTGIRRSVSEPLKQRASRWTLHDASPLIDAGHLLDASQLGMPGDSEITLDITHDLFGRERDKKPDVGCEEWPLERGQPSRSGDRVGPTWASTELIP